MVDVPSERDDQLQTSSSSTEEAAPAGAPPPVPEAVVSGGSAAAIIQPMAAEDEPARADEGHMTVLEPSPSPSIEGDGPVEPIGETTTGDLGAEPSWLLESDMVEAEAPQMEARDITLTKVTTDLLKFVPFTDLVPCDFDQDGVVDVLALNAKLSTGYGFKGVGNGLFTEGPSFDLPFRPTAAEPLGKCTQNENGLFLVSSSGMVSMFYPSTGEDPTASAPCDSLSSYRLDTEAGSVFAVHGADEASVHLFLSSATGLEDMGIRQATAFTGALTWYDEITKWSPGDHGCIFPLLPGGMEKMVRIADLNRDGILDLVQYDAGDLIFLLSQGGEPLAAHKTIPLLRNPTSIRLADLTGNGFPDVLVLHGASGTLEVFLSEPL